MKGYAVPERLTRHADSCRTSTSWRNRTRRPDCARDLAVARAFVVLEVAPPVRIQDTFRHGPELILEQRTPRRAHLAELGAQLAFGGATHIQVPFFMFGQRSLEGGPAPHQRRISTCRRSPLWQQRFRPQAHVEASYLTAGSAKLPSRVPGHVPTRGPEAGMAVDLRPGSEH